MSRPDYAAYKQAIQGETLPLAYVDLERLDDNIRRIVSQRQGKTIRVASKSVRSVAMLRYLLQADASLQGVLCYTAPEAVYLAQHGLDDLVVAYPTWEPGHIAAVAQAVRAGRRLTLMVDSLAHVEQVNRISRREQVILPVCLDVDLSDRYPGLHFGVQRSPLRTTAAALAVVEAIAAADHLRLDGLMGYEAQIAGVGDNLPGRPAQNRLVRLLQRRSRSQVAARRAELTAAIQARGLQLRFVNGGGTGSLASTAAEPAVTEITVGSGFYAPRLFDFYTTFRYRPAAGFALPIVRRPAPGLYTCLGGGYIASGAAGPEKLPVPYLPEGAALLPLEGAGEVQTPVRYSGAEPLGLGDPIFFRHSKAGELCEHFQELLLLAGGRVVDRVTTYRGDGRCFL